MRATAAPPGDGDLLQGSVRRVKSQPFSIRRKKGGARPLCPREGLSFQAIQRSKKYLLCPGVNRHIGKLRFIWGNRNCWKVPCGKLVAWR